MQRHWVWPKKLATIIGLRNILAGRADVESRAHRHRTAAILLVEAQMIMLHQEAAAIADS